MPHCLEVCCPALSTAATMLLTPASQRRRTALTQYQRLAVVRRFAMPHIPRSCSSSAQGSRRAFAVKAQPRGECLRPPAPRSPPQLPPLFTLPGRADRAAAPPRQLRTGRQRRSTLFCATPYHQQLPRRAPPPQLCRSVTTSACAVRPHHTGTAHVIQRMTMLLGSPHSSTLLHRRSTTSTRAPLAATPCTRLQRSNLSPSRLRQTLNRAHPTLRTQRFRRRRCCAGSPRSRTQQMPNASIVCRP